MRSCQSWPSWTWSRHFPHSLTSVCFSPQWTWLPCDTLNDLCNIIKNAPWSKPLTTTEPVPQRLPVTQPYLSILPTSLLLISSPYVEFLECRDSSFEGRLLYARTPLLMLEPRSLRATPLSFHGVWSCRQQL